MVKRISIFMLAVVSAVILAGCTARGTDENQTQADISGNNQALTTEDIKLTENPAEEPTEVPTEEPTPEPTATPAPHITDPTGHVPEDVEIFCLEKNGSVFGRACIVKKDDGYYAQYWSDKELKSELLIPDEMVEELDYLDYYSKVEGGNIIVETIHTDGTHSVYWKTQKGSLALRGYLGWEDDWQEYLVEHNVIIAVDPTWDSYYYKETFPEDVDLEFDSSHNSWIDKNTGKYIDFKKNDEKTEKIKL